MDGGRSNDGLNHGVNQNKKKLKSNHTKQNDLYAERMISNENRYEYKNCLLKQQPKKKHPEA